jgi:alpha-glucoside transport system permease protein
MTTTTALPEVVPDPSVTARRRGFAFRSAATEEQGKTSGQKRAGWITRIIIAFICLLWIVPTIGTIVTSFRTVDAANTSGWWSLLTDPGSFTRLTLGNYSSLFSSNYGFGDAFINSLAISLPATVIPILFAAFAAYAFTFMRFKGREFLFVLVVALLVVPNQTAFLPLLKLYTRVGINGTFEAVWLFHAAFAMPLAIYIFRNYMATLPNEVIESAKVDGATHFQTFWRLVIPMSTPALAAFAIFQFLWVWNDLLVALVFISPTRQPLPLVVQALVSAQSTSGWQLVTAAGVLMMVVPVAVFLALQRYFVRGLTAGAVKG